MKNWEKRVIEHGTGTCVREGCDMPAEGVLTFLHGREAMCESHYLEVVNARRQREGLEPLS